MTLSQLPGHVALLAGRKRDGQLVHEVVPAQPRPDGLWRLLGTPALAEGCAEGDLLSVTDQGAFTVAERGGNVSVVSYATAGQSLIPHMASLRDYLGPEAKVEAHREGRWLVATIPIGVGFPAIQTALRDWVAQTGQTWSYGNVYDENDEPLNWW